MEQPQAARLPGGVAFAVARTAAQVPSAALAQTAGVSRWYLSRVESGALPVSGTLLTRLYGALGRVTGARLEAGLPPEFREAAMPRRRTLAGWETRRANAAATLAQRAPHAQEATGDAA